MKAKLLSTGNILVELDPTHPDYEHLCALIWARSGGKNPDDSPVQKALDSRINALGAVLSVKLLATPKRISADLARYQGLTERNGKAA